MQKRVSAFLLLFLLSACGQKDPYSEYYGNWDGGMTLAAKCVALSERFFLYEQALDHYKQGLEFQSLINRKKLSSANVSNDLPKSESDSLETRIMLIRKGINYVPTDKKEAESSKQFAAQSLIESCNVKLLNSQFQAVP